MIELTHYEQLFCMQYIMYGINNEHLIGFSGNSKVDLATHLAIWILS